jgi:hypothetical protein
LPDPLKEVLYTLSQKPERVPRLSAVQERVVPYPGVYSLENTFPLERKYQSMPLGKI